METRDKDVDMYGGGDADVTAQPEGISRRSMLMGTGFAALAGVAGFAFGRGTMPQVEAASSIHDLTYPFYGQHQSGILTPAQQQMYTVAIDLNEKMTRTRVVTLFKEWTEAARRMCAGSPVEDPNTNTGIVPGDTGETYDLCAAGLTITFGLGSTFFEKDGVDRFGLAERKPSLLKENFAQMSNDKLEEARCGGDIVIQACAEDPMVTLHAIHQLTRIAMGKGEVKWGQLGYGRTSSTSTEQATPRNLFGFKDGTSNIKGDEKDQESVNTNLWIQPEDEGGEFFADGSYMCCRRIKMHMERWDNQSLGEQELVVGRDKFHGAPLSGGEEFTDPDFAKEDASGNTMIPWDSHMAIVHPDNNGGHRMLRRGYNYVEGNGAGGRFEGGLFFIAFVRNPQTNFEEILSKMQRDQMAEYLTHTGSALFLILPGIAEGDDYIGQKLFEA